MLTDVHVATDMRPEDSRGFPLARDILCLNVSIRFVWWWSGSSAHNRMLLDDIGRLLGPGNVSLLQKLKVFVRWIEAQRSLRGLVSNKVAAAGLVIGCTTASGRSDLVLFLLRNTLAPRREAQILYTALDIYGIAEPRDVSQPFIEYEF